MLYLQPFNLRGYWKLASRASPSLPSESALIIPLGAWSHEDIATLKTTLSTLKSTLTTEVQPADLCVWIAGICVFLSLVNSKAASRPTTKPGIRVRPKPPVRDSSLHCWSKGHLVIFRGGREKHKGSPPPPLPGGAPLDSVEDEKANPEEATHFHFYQKSIQSAYLPDQCPARPYAQPLQRTQEGRAATEVQSRPAENFY